METKIVGIILNGREDYMYIVNCRWLLIYRTVSRHVTNPKRVVPLHDQLSVTSLCPHTHTWVFFTLIREGPVRLMRRMVRAFPVTYSLSQLIKLY